MVRPRGEEERERGGRCCQATKGWGEIPARSGQDRLSPARLRRRRPTKARRRLYKVTPGSGSGADPAWPALEGPEVQTVAKVTVCAEEIFSAHSGPEYTTEYNSVCKIIRQVCALYNTESRRKTTCIKWRLLGLDKFHHG